MGSYSMDDAVSGIEESAIVKDLKEKRVVERCQRRNLVSIGRERFGNRRGYEYAVLASVAVFWLVVSLIPVYNKFFFRKYLFPYPIATAGIQLGVVSILLGALNVAQHLARNRNGLPQASPSSSSNNNDEQACTSWILGPHFFWKLKWCTPIGVLFGLKYGVTNLGLHLVPAPTHLLLQATDLVWTILSAWTINGEQVTRVEFGALAGCVLGSFVLGWQLHDEDTLSAPAFAIFINLLSPVLLGLCLATLRLACCELMRPDNRVRGTVSAVELTSIKLLISSLVAILLATLFERGFDGHHEYPWWHAFDILPVSTKVGVICGALLIAIFQVNCTFLTFLTSTVSVGLVGQVKIIPQWIFAAVFATATKTFTPKPMNIIGAVLIMTSAAAFAISNWMENDFDENSDQHQDSRELPEKRTRKDKLYGNVTENEQKYKACECEHRSLLLDNNSPCSNCHLRVYDDASSATSAQTNYDSLNSCEPTAESAV